jgi:hypothetical protein
MRRHSIAWLAVVPAWPYSRRCGYGPSGVVTLILVIQLLVWLFRRVAFSIEAVRMTRSRTPGLRGSVPAPQW